MPLDQVKTRTQPCPLCKQEQDIILMGHFQNPDKPDTILYSQYNGYSFCNCRNIFFTDWSNIIQAIYNPNYYKRYDQEGLRIRYETAAKFYGVHMPLKEGSKVLEIGAISTPVLDYFKSVGLETIGLDIHQHPLGDHKLIVSDFEKLIPSDKFDMIWASHIFEHFRDPIGAVKKCNELLNEDGYLFVGMPDPFFIDFGNVGIWGHWHLFEHHILWDMDSFCDLLRENGFEIIYKHRNTGVELICTLDYGIVAKKRLPIEAYAQKDTGNGGIDV